jgi:hypothetical protein
MGDEKKMKYFCRFCEIEHNDNTPLGKIHIDYKKR